MAPLPTSSPAEWGRTRNVAFIDNHGFPNQHGLTRHIPWKVSLRHMWNDWQRSSQILPYCYAVRSRNCRSKIHWRLAMAKLRYSGPTSKPETGSHRRLQPFPGMNLATAWLCIVTITPCSIAISFLYVSSLMFANSYWSTTLVTPSFSSSTVKPSPLTSWIATHHSLPY